MAIIDETYLQTAPKRIPNAKDISAQPVGTPTNQSVVEQLIAKYVPEVMLMAFGPVMRDAINSALLQQPFDPGAATIADQKWVDLIVGETYVVDGKSYFWEGLRGINKDSLIAYFVFCQYMLFDESLLTTTGTVKPKAKNAAKADPTPKFVRMWHEFLGKYQGGAYYDDGPSIIVNGSGEVGLDYYHGDRKNNQRSLYQYLTDKNELDATTFPDLEFQFILDEDSHNSFGI